MDTINWTEERVELLKRLWGEGLSASQIAQELGGVTRNAVIGKVHRLNLSGRAKTPSSAPRLRKSRPATPRAPGRPVIVGNTALKMQPRPAPTPRRLPVQEDVVVPISLNKPLVELTEQTCKWPNGDPATEDFGFCGHPSREDGPYCEYHSRLAYQPSHDRRRDRDVE